jgi:SAM-dependent methyltransferase
MAGLSSATPRINGEVSLAEPPIGTPEYFEVIHLADPDPFGLHTRRYEQRKRSIVLAMLPRPAYHRVFEPGCSAGAFTIELARRCDTVVAFDLSPAAVARAKEYLRAAGISNVRLEVGTVPERWPSVRVDLLVLGELGYYLDAGRLERVVASSAASLEPGGHLLAVHWRLPIENCSLTGDQVHDVLRSSTALRHLAHYEEEQFLVDVFERPPGPGLPRP